MAAAPSPTVDGGRFHSSLSLQALETATSGPDAKDNPKWESSMIDVRRDMLERACQSWGKAYGFVITSRLQPVPNHSI